MIDETRKALEAYCPEVGLPLKRYGIYDRFSVQEINAVIAAAIREAIIGKGEWKRFLSFAFYLGSCETDQPMGTIKDEELAGENQYYDEDFTQWLTDPETFCRVAGEWVGRKL